MALGHTTKGEANMDITVKYNAAQEIVVFINGEEVGTLTLREALELQAQITKVALAIAPN